MRNSSALCMYSIFLSTLSLRRATVYHVAPSLLRGISIHALLAESDVLTSAEMNYYTISIHALLAESDRWHVPDIAALDGFLSTLSLRRATPALPGLRLQDQISIHALLAESDCSGFNIRCISQHFYPRSPCGERHTHPIDILVRIVISIHALLAESDHKQFLLM